MDNVDYDGPKKAMQRLEVVLPIGPVWWECILEGRGSHVYR